jgi:phosphatidate cytidylyltransferase
VSEFKAVPSQATPRDSRNLLARAAAALVLAPLAVIAAYAGGWWWTALVTLTAIGLFIEWLTVVSPGREVRLSIAVTGSVALAVGGVCLMSAGIVAPFAIVAAGLAAIAALSPVPRRWVLGGFLYAAAAQMASILVRQGHFDGLTALLLVLLVVWASDIGGFFAGRAFGGPKLWPRVSPNKTWAGALGGFLASLLIGAGFGYFGFGKIGPMLLASAALSVASQLGDLLESAVKRRFGVKDSSHLIPGHGGLMDRLDGYVAAIVMAAAFELWRHGVDGAGRALMVW